jgi:hypothetical protein
MWVVRVLLITRLDLLSGCSHEARFDPHSCAMRPRMSGAPGTRLWGMASDTSTPHRFSARLTTALSELTPGQ